MRICYFLLFFVFIYSGLHAQSDTTCGRYLIGVLLNTSSDEDEISTLFPDSINGDAKSLTSFTTTSISVAPYLIYKLRPGTWIGVQVAYDNTSFGSQSSSFIKDTLSFESTQSQSTQSLSAGVMFRQVLNPEQRFQLHIQSLAFYGQSSTGGDSNGVSFTNDTRKNYGISISPGVSYWVNENFRVLATLGTSSIVHSEIFLPNSPTFVSSSNKIYHRFSLNAFTYGLEVSF